jgi:ubiquitin C-terminal hydrolase
MIIFRDAAKDGERIQYIPGMQLCSAEFLQYILEEIDTYLSKRCIPEFTPGAGDAVILDQQTQSLDAWITSFAIDKSIPRSPMLYSPILDNMHGQTEAITFCTNCKAKSSQRYDTWGKLEVSIPGSDTHGARAPTLLECIADRFNDEIMEDYECEDCNFRKKVREICKATHSPPEHKPCCKDCYKLATGTIRNRLSRSPKELVIELKRYMFDKLHPTHPPKKVTGGILWDLDDLNLTPYLAFQSPFKTPPPRYKTYAVIEHEGSTPNSGHYFVRIRRGNKWFEYNDSAPVREIPKEYVITNNSYLIFASSDHTYSFDTDYLACKDMSALPV